ncbi:Uu.00g091890.m01.CDS01 [Anthostomella pinea]|uniref:Uu.00g091890.m01.CDS01 n=1 Tax=Anthostomella pinea TaxID=933095 RepID=A0AAI8VHQ3_9PEZI|nr:Uu.00g091890.m01.CDS01 [Anthostomella pinea]
MGIYPRLDLRQPLSVTDAPPGLVSPSSSTHSSKISEDRFWNHSAPVSPPMSNYDPNTRPDMSAGKGSEEGQARREPPSQAPRQQLPSLSSIFGPSQLVRPLHSPHTDRPSPVYGAQSPPERPHSAAANPERPYSRSSSYFPNVSPLMNQPRSVYEPRLELERRPTLPSLAHDFPGPLSPPTREFEYAQHASRNESSSGGRWSQSSYQDARRPEYVFGSQPSTPSFRPVSERMPLPSLGQSLGLESGSGLKKEAQMHAGLLNRSPTLASTASSEGLPVKDGLGPKIWTGTHFLPRFVRQAEVPGEGICYFYDDGTHCKTVIDGEAVNAHWGVTKAGKPRKRLAIACLTCREKKIKCDPDFPRCVQCEKFGRVCKFKNAPRGGHNTSPLTSPVEHDDSRQPGVLPRPAELGRPTSPPSASVSPRTTKLSHPSPELPGLPSKRMRFSYEHYPPSGSRPSPMMPAPEIRTAATPWQHRDLPRIHEDVLCRKWQTDPYVSDPQATISTITSFFSHVRAMALRFLPERIFTDWVQGDYDAHTRKSPEDLMLVYSQLAFGLHVAGGSKHLASQHAQVARFATQKSSPSLQLVQTKLILSLFYHATSRAFDSIDMLNGAISAALYARLNLELDLCIEGAQRKPYGMDKATYAECRRRTFFSCFIWERLNGFCPPRPLMLNAQDVFLQLPQHEKAFDEGHSSAKPTPCLDVNRDIASLPDSVGIMGHLVLIVEVYGRIMEWVQREATRAHPTEPDHLKVLEKMAARLRQCQDALPQDYRFSDKNLAKASEDGVEGCLIIRHLVGLLARTKFARHAQSALTRSLPLDDRARKSLALGGDLMFVALALRDQVRARRHSDAPFVLAPFAINAAVEAVDLLSATGPVSSIPNSIHELDTAKYLCDVLSTEWEDPNSQKAVLERRAETLLLIHGRASNAITNPIPGCEVYVAPTSTKSLLYRIHEPLETRWPHEMDAVYTQHRGTQHSANTAAAS